MDDTAKGILIVSAVIIIGILLGLIIVQAIWG